MNETYFFAVQEGRILLERRVGRRWQGLWTLPVLSKAPDSADVQVSEVPFVRVRHAITRFAVELSVFVREPPKHLGEGQEWKTLASLEDLPMPSPHRRALKLALEALQLKGAKSSTFLTWILHE
jgi:A/G-specific adenine glycosylase